MSAHSGFLNSAEALSAIVEERIRAAADTVHHVILTGHSAGGAVATLLYLRCRSLVPSTTRVSCVTFGAPPCVSGFTESIEEGSGGVRLNIVNEFDMVYRVDGPYILSMVNLLRGMYGLSGLVPAHENLGLEKAWSHSSEDTKCGYVWGLPAPLYRHVGKTIVLVTRLEGSEDEKEVVMRALEVPREVIEGLLFCRLEVHKRVSYAERVKMLEEGRVNGNL